MAVESSLSFAVYNGTGSASVGYPIPFSYTDPDHIRVSVQAQGETEPTVLASSMYDITADPAGVYTTLAYPSTTKVTIERVIPLTQPTVWPEGGRFLAATHEAAADRAVMQIQQLARDTSQSIRVPLSSGVPDVLTPTPGALMGFDTAGAYVHYDAARVRELAQLEGGLATNSTATFADATARASTVPSFTGQLGLQRDDRSLWTSLGTTGGNWASIIPHKIVRNEDQLAAAVAAGGRIGIDGVINLTSTLQITQPNTILYAASGNAALVYQHDTGVAHTVIEISAKNAWLDGIEITTNHPLISSIPVYNASPTPPAKHYTFNLAVYDTAVSLDADATTDISGFRMTNCWVHHVMYCVRRVGNSDTSVFAENIVIAGNRFESFGHYCLELVARFRGLIISKNKIRGRVGSESHQQIGNGIWLGNRADRVLIEGNEISQCGRHAIEYWNSQINPPNTDGNLNAIITGNLIHDMVNDYWPSGGGGDRGEGSFGISAFGNGVVRIANNTVRDCTIGIETYGDQTNLGYLHCTDNSIERWGQWGSLSTGISINGIRGGAMIANNRIGEAVYSATNGTQIGILVINGGTNVHVEGNHLYDTGMHGLLVLGRFLSITGITQATNAEVTTSLPFSTSINNGWGAGKRIYIQNIPGGSGSMADLNGKYYTIASIVNETCDSNNVCTATKFTIEVDTTAKTAYSGNAGRVLERYDGLVIMNNVVRRTRLFYDPLNSAFRATMWLVSVQKAVVKNNVSYTAASVSNNGPTPPAIGLSTFALSSFGTVYTGNTADSPTIAAADSALSALLGSNLEIDLPI